MKIQLLTSALLLSLVGCQHFDGQNSNNSSSSSIVSHPKKLKFSEPTYRIPVAKDHQYTLSSGDTVYIVEDNSLPLVNISIQSPYASFLEPTHRYGLASLTTTMLRDGGTKKLSPEALDEKLDFLSTQISFNVGSTRSTAHVDSLTENLDESLQLLTDMLVHPKFDKERLSINKSKVLEQMKKRNDDTRDMEPRYWNELAYGEKHVLSRLATERSIQSINTKDLSSFSKTLFRQGDLVIAVSGNVKPKELIAKLEALVSKLPKKAKSELDYGDIHAATPGLYGVAKEGVSQSRVVLGHQSVMYDHPDAFALQVMNDILGGGGFTSRITKRVRSDEGLAYHASSRYALQTSFPGQFRVVYQSKNRSVAYALKLVFEEIDRIQSQPVSEQELSTAKNSTLAYLNEIFEGADRTVGRFANDHMEGRPADYWHQFKKGIEAVTISDIQRVAKTHLRKEQLKILVVGNIEEVMPGDGEHGTLEGVAGLKLKPLPLKDPMTLKAL